MKNVKYHSRQNLKYVMKLLDVGKLIPHFKIEPIKLWKTLTYFIPDSILKAIITP